MQPARFIEVSAALIFRAGRLLITQRRADAHLGGCWEFPGGKREAGETFEQCLAREIREAVGRGRDVADRRALARYQTDHMRASRPLYLATNATALFYTDDRLPARVLRAAALRVGSRLGPFRRAVAERLLDAG